MTDPITTYLHDHLAGARFAVSLLKDLASQCLDNEVRSFSASLLEEIEADRLVLEGFANRIGGDSSTFKEAAAWVAQKAGRFKLTLDEPMGIFEAIEVLALGVLGKLALWSALETVRETDSRLEGLELEQLKARARTQHQRLESLRLKLARATLRLTDR
jgi:hypothetical protein